MMKVDPESWPTLSRLLDQWLDLPEGSRAGWLENLGPEYVDVLPVLRRLISTSASIEAEGFLNTLPRMEESAMDESAMDNSAIATRTGGAPVFAALTAGTLIGPYRLIRELGQGGMGVVWQAERADGEVKRPVGLKLPIVSLHNPALADRFARERDILAQLTHPHIARLYDAGITDRGQPYLALEYVEGEKITSYCDRRRLGLKPRLQLFQQVLRAVQYAHTNLIVHRDLKPANILVTKEGDVRLLDFGIAKLLTAGEANETELTRVGGRALTPEYASPEQITGNTVTTASDVYSLGVVLYELLSGGRPYKLKRETRSGLEDAILDAQPVRPSQAATGQTAAQARGLTVKRLARGLKGDLDTIILKALSKQPPQRYATADAFSQDIERYLAGEAVLAQPESVWYRVRKLVLRNKLAVSSAAVVIAALSIGLAVALREAQIAQVQTRTAEAVRTFLLDIFRANSGEHADPVKARQTTARELLDIGAKKIDGALHEAPEAKLVMFETLFRLYNDLGLKEYAIALGQRRIALARSVYGPSHPELARAMLDLAANSRETSLAKDNAPPLKEAGAILDRNRDFTSRTRALYDFAMAEGFKDSDLAKAAGFADEAVRLYRSFPPSSELVSALDQAGQIRYTQKKYPEAIASFSEGARLANSLQGLARNVLPKTYAVLGDAQRQTMDLGGAEKSLRLAVEMARSLNGEEHEDVLQTKYYLGLFLCQTARPQEGLRLLKEAVDLAVRTKGPEDGFHTPMVRRAYGVNLLQYGRVEEGLVPLTQSVEASRRAQRASTRNFADALALGSEGELVLGNYPRAGAMIEEASAIHTRLGSTISSGQLTNTILMRAKLLVATGKAGEAAKSLQEAPFKTSAPGALSYPWLSASVTLAEANMALNQYDTAVRQASEVRNRIEGSTLRPYLKRYEAQAALQEGKGLQLMGRAPEALPLLQRAVQLGSDVYDTNRGPALADSQIALAKCLLALGRRDLARPLAARAKAIHATHKNLGEQFRKPLRELEALLANRN